MSKHNRLKALAVAVPAAIAFGLGASACSGEPTPAPEPKAATATATSEAPVDLTAVEVTGGPIEELGSVGAYKDQALSACGEVSDVTATPESVATARAAADAIDNSVIGHRADLCIDGHLAETTIYLDLHSYRDTDEIVEDNDKEVAARRAIADLIEDVDLKKIAQENLDYEIAQEAVKSGADDYDGPEAKISAGLLALIKSPEIKELATKAIAGDEDAGAKLDELAREAADAAKSAGTQPWRNIYDGSNTQARAINSELEAFSAARAADGQ